MLAPERRPAPAVRRRLMRTTMAPLRRAAGARAASRSSSEPRAKSQQKRRRSLLRETPEGRCCSRVGRCRRSRSYVVGSAVRADPRPSEKPLYISVGIPET